MPQGTFTPWQILPPYNMGAPGSANISGGGGGIGPYFRDALDARRSAWNRTPEAMYPDGYLGTINSRRGDRLLDSLKNRENQRSYQRGVHKGERIDPADYIFPPGLGLDAGVEREASGVMVDTLVLSPRYAPAGANMPQYSPRQQSLWGADPGIGAPSATTAMRRLAPPWR